MSSSEEQIASQRTMRLLNKIMRDCAEKGLLLSFSQLAAVFERQISQDHAFIARWIVTVNRDDDSCEVTVFVAPRDVVEQLGGIET